MCDSKQKGRKKSGFRVGPFSRMGECPAWSGEKRAFETGKSGGEEKAEGPQRKTKERKIGKKVIAPEAAPG